MQLVFEQNKIASSLINRTEGSFGKPIGIFGKLFGCWHRELTKPITSKRNTYRACLDCGARRKFDPTEFRSTGPFYYPPAVKSESV
jgi:hypothetical protein